MKNASLKIEEKKGHLMKTYFFRVEIVQDEDGRWGAEIPSLPGCNAWGFTKEGALNALKEAAELYVEDMIEAGDEMPTKDVESSNKGVEVMEAPVVRITL